MQKQSYIILSRLRPPSSMGRGITPQAGIRTLDQQDGADTAPVQVDVRPLDLKEVRDLQQEPDVNIAAAMPLRLVQPRGEATLEAAAASQAWGLEAVGATRTTLTGKGVVVAVLDTGIDEKHAAFKHLGARLVTRNFTTSAPEDTNGHGTHCAGTIFGDSVGGKRIGVAPGIKKALVGKVLGAGTNSGTLVQAIQWAVAEGANVISMSLGIDFPGYAASLQDEGLPPDIATSRALQAYRDNVRLFDALSSLVRAGGFLQQPTIVVVAAGNESRADENEEFLVTLGVPAAADGFISVGAVGRKDGGFEMATFSNMGPTLCGPGVDILSARRGGGLTTLSGTSMATPHVAGVAALWIEQMKKSGQKLTAEALHANLLGRAQLLPLPPERAGRGLVRAPE
jgi:subtilisin family serine protease